MTGEHAMRHFKTLRPGDVVDTYTDRGGPHHGRVIAADTGPRTPSEAASPHDTILRLDCTICEAEHTVTDSPWRLVAAVRQP